MSLVNRQGSNLNRKKITIESVTNGLNQGSVIYANIERADSPTTVGTELTAQNLENAIVNIVNERIPTTTSTTIGVTQCVCTSDSSVATTEFVWNVLTALGLNKINHNHTSTSTGTGSSSGGSTGSGGGSTGSSGT